MNTKKTMAKKVLYIPYDAIKKRRAGRTHSALGSLTYIENHLKEAISKVKKFRVLLKKQAATFEDAEMLKDEIVNHCWDDSFFEDMAALDEIFHIEEYLTSTK